MPGAEPMMAFIRTGKRMIRLQKNFVNRLVMTIMMRLLLCWRAVLSIQTDRER